ncbi:Gfo/Idh/MocA family oxidoreductase [Sphingobacterium sp. lm-10]|uniref:Gfo/Idh/MocA family protein n=1 Tax=Sphingobacterium sp. lm-10 TaxID=2944904 RepID=UPI0020218142|nr:Gfo/Idh/MocA family oxidoreductase [Sphingobacterium sp. lm-10]MCL7987112.1 Gfo/Idh/MocA family oxidoreductase [Sphingobacterium sp. lm-10]
MKQNHVSIIPLYIAFILILFPAGMRAIAQQKLDVVVAGLSHDHVYEIMNRYEKGEVNIIGISESNTDLIHRFQQRYKLHDSLFYHDLASLLKMRKPDVVLAYNAIDDHLAVVEAAAPLGISVMVEKPLATTVKQAERMAELARKYQIHVLTNYETTWYASNQEAYTKIKDKQEIGKIRKMIVHDGHQGPKEINVSKEFLSWLTDPVKNGGGALVDFGCYGANLMTWLMDGKAPIAVTAVTRQLKKEVYPHVDDDATILLEYPEATGIIEASWNWPFSIKDMEIFGQTGYIQAVNPTTLRIKEKEGVPYKESLATPLPTHSSNHLNYLSALLHHNIKPERDLSSLENNLIVVKILEAAKTSAKTGRRVLIK